jgi:hypothetical protein
MSVNDEWANFLSNQNAVSTSNRCVGGRPTISVDNSINTKKGVCVDNTINNEGDVPVCEELYISTKTKVLFLNKEIDIYNIFWNIPVLEYWKPEEGVIKKQMKIVSKTQEEFQEYKKKLDVIGYYTENIIKQIDNPTARRIKFKDERKITVGVSKKDIMNCRGKVKNAFYNCFAMILRFKYGGAAENKTMFTQSKNVIRPADSNSSGSVTDKEINPSTIAKQGADSNLQRFKEIHVKIFNTGKLEIPGVLDAKLLDIVKEMILQILQPNIDTLLEFIETDSENNVLINSNFNCGYYINRDILHNILLSDKYNIESAYDPCSYPGVKCKYYFNNNNGFDETLQKGKILPEDRALKLSELELNKKYTEVSFMMFRTGSCLIVGNCSERILKFVFEFIKKILVEEYKNIQVANEDTAVKIKKVKLRKKTILMSADYYAKHM